MLRLYQLGTHGSLLYDFLLVDIKGTRLRMWLSGPTLSLGLISSTMCVCVCRGGAEQQTQKQENAAEKYLQTVCLVIFQPGPRGAAYLTVPPLLSPGVQEELTVLWLFCRAINPTTICYLECTGKVKILDPLNSSSISELGTVSPMPVVLTKLPHKSHSHHSACVFFFLAKVSGPHRFCIVHVGSLPHRPLFFTWCRLFTYFYWWEPAILYVLVLDSSWILWDFMPRNPNGPDTYHISPWGWSGRMYLAWMVLEVALQQELFTWTWSRLARATR